MELNNIYKVEFKVDIDMIWTDDWYNNPNREMFDIDDYGNGKIEIKGKNQDEAFDRFYNLIGTEDLYLNAIYTKTEDDRFYGVIHYSYVKDNKEYKGEKRINLRGSHNPNLQEWSQENTYGAWLLILINSMGNRATNSTLKFIEFEELTEEEYFKREEVA